MPDSPLPAMPDPLLPVKPVSPLPAKQDPLLPACSQWGQIVKEVRVRISERWDQECQICGSKARSKASCQLIANSDSLLTAMPRPLLLTCFKHVQIHWYQWSLFHPYQWSWIHHYQRSQIHHYQRSQIHHYQLAPIETRLSERWKWACESGQTKHVRALKVSISELWEAAYQLWEWACQSCGSELVSIVRVSMSELWEWLKLVRVVQVNSSELKQFMFKMRKEMSE